MYIHNKYYVFQLPKAASTLVYTLCTELCLLANIVLLTLYFSGCLIFPPLTVHITYESYLRRYNLLTSERWYFSLTSHSFPKTQSPFQTVFESFESTTIAYLVVLLSTLNVSHFVVA